MKKITIVIPTRYRIQKLVKTLESIPKTNYIDIIIGIDNEIETGEYLEKHYRKDISWLTFYNKDSAEPYGAVNIRNKIIEEVEDGCLYATDDILFNKNSIEQALLTFNSKFEDEDGVVGFVQEPGEFHPTGVGLVGQKFLQRYPFRHLFYPGYFHFACQELYWLANKYSKFYQEKNAVITHYHPCKFEEELDQTHVDARKYKNKDMKLIKQREKENIIWGDNCAID